jgi:DNA-binding MarR family transcriptional regulator
LDLFQIKILNAILFAEEKKQQICVSDLLAMSDIASPATVHAALKKLTSKNLLMFETIPDNRSKFIKLTREGQERFTTLSNSLKKI